VANGDELSDEELDEVAPFGTPDETGEIDVQEVEFRPGVEPDYIDELERDDGPDVDSEDVIDASNPVTATFDIAFDFPGASVQDTLRGAATEAGGFEDDEEFAREYQEAVIGSRREIAERSQEAGEGTPVEGFNQTGTAAGTVFDAFVTDPLRAGSEALLGVDPLGDRKTFVSNEENVDPDEAVTGETDESVGLLQSLDLVLPFVGGGGAKAVFKSTKSASSMSLLSGLRRVPNAFRRGDSVPSSADEIPGGVDSQAEGFANMDFEDFAGTQVSAGTDNAATQVTDSADELNFNQNIDEAIDSTTPRVQDDTDLGARFADEFDDVGSGGGATDDGFDFATDSGNSGGISDEISDFLGDSSRRGSDEFTASIDEQNRARRAADDGGQAVDESTEAAEDSGIISRSLSRVRQNPSVPFIGGVLGASAVSDALGGGGPDIPRSAGPYERAASYTINGYEGFAIRIAPEGTMQGFAVVIPTLGTPMQVLTASGGTRRASISAQAFQNGESGLTAEFSSQQSARRTFQEWANSQGTAGGQQSDLWDGSMQAPRSVTVGETLNVEAEVRNTSRTGEREASFLLAIGQGGSLGRLDSVLKTVPAGESVTVSVSANTQRLSPGDYTLVLAAEGDGGGRIESQALTVNQRGGDGSNATWADAERMQELPQGWTLYRLRGRNGEKTGYVVSGTREDGTTIYMAPGGRVQNDAHVFESVEDASAAFRQWLTEYRQGKTADDETPSTASPSPDPGEVRRSAESQSGGIVASVTDDPVMAAAVLVIVGGGLWYLTGGNPLKWVQSQFNGGN
jgi:hypothetical protein